MLDSIQSLLNPLPEGVIQVRDGLVVWANDAARHCLPQLAEGAPLPDCLPLPGRSPAGSGRFTLGDASFRSDERRVGKECRSRWSPYH